MSVTIDYLVVYSEEMDLMELLTEMLKNALEDVDDEPPEEEELRQYINIRYTKRREDHLRICGFSVEFDSTEERMSELIDNFSESIADCDDEGIKHLLKLNDPQLRHTLRDYGDEIFEIEMKLREALSLIFVKSYDEDFYDLLKEVNVNPSPRESAERMRKYYENQFFFLMFRDYIRINDRTSPSLNEIFKNIGQAENFEELKQMITSNPITEGRYAGFLASLVEQVEPIEELRNCVAHNRSIPEKTMDNYEKVRKPLLDNINKFLEQQANHEGSYETETEN